LTIFGAQLALRSQPRSKLHNQLLTSEVLNHLTHGQQTAGASNDVMRGSGFNKLKAVAERASLANQSVKLYRSQWHLELQANYFAQWDFREQYGGNAGFANIHRAPSHHRAVTRINANLDLQFKAGTLTVFNRLLGRGVPILPMDCHSESS
jgi:hypothetical protein